jgi:hypothetical protein
VVGLVLTFFMDRGVLIIREASGTATEADLIVLEERQRKYEREHSMEPFSLEHRDVFVPYEGGVVRTHPSSFPSRPPFLPSRPPSLSALPPPPTAISFYLATRRGWTHR